jgi:hypothetical protein
MTIRYWNRNLEEMMESKVHFNVVGNFFALGYNMKYRDTKIFATSDSGGEKPGENPPDFEEFDETQAYHIEFLEEQILRYRHGLKEQTYQEFLDELIVRIRNGFNKPTFQEYKEFLQAQILRYRDGLDEESYQEFVEEQIRQYLEEDNERTSREILDKWNERTY